MLTGKAIRCAVKSGRPFLLRCIPRQLSSLKGGAVKSKCPQWTLFAPLKRPSPTSNSTFRLFSSSIKPSSQETPQTNAVRILFGSQGGTAQIFAMQLSEELEELNCPVEMLALNEASTPADHLKPGKALHVFLISVAGVGEPPNNARAFYDWLMKQKGISDDDIPFSALQYAVFGLGNQKAHPNHYNVIGKNIDKRLEELGAHRLLPVGLGDDGECLEDDFDTWKNIIKKVIIKIKTGDDQNNEIEREVHEDDEQTDFADVVNGQEPLKAPVPTEGSTDESVSRRISDKYPRLQIYPNDSPISCQDDLFRLQSTVKRFYQEGTSKLPVTANRILSASAGESGLRELQISLNGDATQRYEAGDHCIIYPCNAGCIVEAFLHVLDVDANTIIGEPDSKTTSTRKRPYPHPVDITLHETLTHCVDLGAPPTPSFSRLLLGRQDIDYREDIVEPRRTVLDLIHEADHLPSLEELLYNLPPMKPRYYSIASSALVHPNDVILTYRPVKYVTNRGYLREGVCTSYMTHLGVGETSTSHVAAAIRSNPTFRLPKEKRTPILMIAGGCGVAPIRAFLEERIALAPSTSFGKGCLYLGFRSPLDEVYRPMIQKAKECGAITDVKITYSKGCTNPALVSTTVRENGAEVFALLQAGGYVYMCGGARAFGAAVEREILAVFQEHGKMSLDDASNYLRQLINEGRLCEDLAD